MLKRVSIQNFKSLKDVTLDLQKVNLLIGPNNSGKTNFLKALKFFDIAFWTALSGKDYIEYHKSVAYKRGDLPTSFFIDAEDLDNNDIREYVFVIDSEQGLVTRYWDTKKEWSGRRSLPISKVDFNRDTLISSYLRLVKIYRPNPSKLTEPYPLLANSDSVEEDCSNIVSYLDTLQGKYTDENFEDIRRDLTYCINEFSSIRFDTVDVPEDNDLRKLYRDKTFKKLGLYNKLQRLIYWSDELSEGTLYFLALLCIIHQPNPPKLLLLEEPERGIHPRRIWEVMKFIFQLAEEKDIQIILTSHNEHVVNAFSSMPEAVFVFDKDEEGATEVRNLQKDIIEPSHKKSEEFGLDKIDFTEDLGENWLYGLLGGVPTDND
ncbi:chromosome segregation protein SMC [Larkinella knui]|uniref:Chromosome segregation protein SMC n=2 Tax=Larkinella knui TaxID=2025310 RepID=A0A3P1CP26_9BACT|nr:chromosome segregation protein SMC [Larkinella knui]